MDLGPGERVEEKDFRSFVENKKPTVGGAAAATAVGRFRKLEEVEFVEGEAEEGAVSVVRLGLRKQEEENGRRKEKSKCQENRLASHQT